MNWSLITAVNDRSVLRTNLLASPGVGGFRDFIPQENAKSAGRAYNAAWTLAHGEVLVFAHQDVFFPPGWMGELGAGLDWLARRDPNWGVLGVWGLTASGVACGHTYCTGLGRVLGSGSAMPVRVRTLDEIVLIIRQGSELRFDERLPGFHLYGTDMCLQAHQKAMSCYAVPAFCVHNTNGLKYLPYSFWRAYAYLRRKWRRDLPVRTPCTTITRSGWPLIRHHLGSLHEHAIKGHQVGCRVPDPLGLYRQLLQRGSVRPRPLSNELSSIRAEVDNSHG